MAGYMQGNMHAFEVRISRGNGIETVTILICQSLRVTLDVVGLKDYVQSWITENMHLPVGETTTLDLPGFNYRGNEIVQLLMECGQTEAGIDLIISAVIPEGGPQSLADQLARHWNG